MLDDLPDDSLRRKLQDYTENPDHTTWSKISEEMKSRTPISGRLKNYEETPDEEVWSGISTKLIVEKNVVWLDAAGRVAATVALLLLLFPLINSNDRAGYIANTEEKAIHQETSQEGSVSDANDSHKIQEIKPLADDDAMLSDDPSKENESPAQAVVDTKVNQHPSEGIRKKNSSKTNPSLNANGQKQRTSLAAEEENERHLISDVTDEALIVSDTVQYTTTWNYKEKHKHENPAVLSDIEPNEINNSQDDVVGSAKEILVTDTLKEQQTELVKKEVKEESADKKADEEEKRLPRPHAIYALLMPTFGYQQVSPVKDDNILIESIEKVGAFSTKRLGIRAEVGFERYVSDRFAVNVGALYYQRKQTINYIFSDPERTGVKAVDTEELLYQIDTRKDTASFEYELRNIGLLLGVNYNLNGKKFTQKAGIAIEMHQGLNKPDAEIATNQKYYLFGNVYYRVSYAISRKFDLMFQPTINYSFQVDRRVDAPFYVKPYGLGLNFGAYYHF